MQNVVFSINGPVVKVKDTKDFSMLEMVYVGNRKLIGEVIGITSEYTTINSLITFSENRNSMQRAPYSPHPIVVEKAKQHIATAVKTDTQLPYTAVKPWIVSSAPAASP